MTRSSSPTATLPLAQLQPITSSSGEMGGWFPGSLNQKEAGCHSSPISFPQPPVSASFVITPLVTSLTLFRTGGTVKLRNSDPFDSPIIDPNFLSTDFDIKTIVAAIKAAKRFITAEAWRGYIVGAWGPLASATTDEELAQYARNHASTYVEPLDNFPLGSSDAIDRI